MPYYKFVCQNVDCRMIEDIFVPVDLRNNVRNCTMCGNRSQRQFGVPYLNTQPEHLRDENKNYFGFNETDRRAEQKKHDKMYAKNYKLGKGDL